MGTATGDAEEHHVNPGQSSVGRKGGTACAVAQPERRKEAGEAGAKARWA